MSRFWVWCCAATLACARINPFTPLEAPEHLSDSRALPPKQLQEEQIVLPPGARILKSVTLTHQDADGSINKIDRRVEKLIDWHEPVTLNQPGANRLPRQMGIFAPIEALEEVDRIRFFTAAELLKINTKDALIRHFFLPKPSRVVMDFNNSTPLESQIAALEGPYFTKIELSFHGAFYRVIVTLDSFYPYTMQPAQDGYLLGLN